MTAAPELTAELRKLVLDVEDDLRERLAADPQNLVRWKGEHEQALKAERTSSAWEAWRDDRITQSAVAWVLNTVFVRFCEDNALVSKVWITGPGPKRQEALDAELDYFRQNPEHTYRDWTLQAVEHFKAMPAARALVESHSPLWQVQPSGAMAKKVLDYWRETRSDGLLLRDLSDPRLSTRFLGDLYQDLSEHAKKTYALLQTPEFVEEFILDQTLTPALKERPLEGFKIIDPTCGSGHFLLGAFQRMLDAWADHAPGLETRLRVQKALDSVNGVDLNPFAVAISKFRLTVAALRAEGLTSIEQAPGYDYHLATGDSLLHGQNQREFRFEGFDADSHLGGFAYATEDLSLLKKILRPGQYDVVVGNPPYIRVSDTTLNKAYRELYPSCHGKYPLSVPFIERFFQLSKFPSSSSQPSGWTGQITDSSFIKRDSGTKLIEKFLPTIDIVKVIDSEGAWIPGHNMDGTPTCILIGKNQRPTQATVRVVLSKGLRETKGTPNGSGPYWTSIAEHIDDDGDFENAWITVTDRDRSAFSTHPWILSGGQTDAVLKKIVKNAQGSLSDKISGNVGFASFPGSDDSFIAPQHELIRTIGNQNLVRPLITGGMIREWQIRSSTCAFVPYNSDGTPIPLSASSPWYRRQWPLRTILGGTVGFDKQSKADTGTGWWEWYRWVPARYATSLTITYAEVATHNHFALDRGGNAFKQTAPVIKLHPDAGDQVHAELLAALNSSVACFWLKQNCKPKGGAADIPWLRTYQFNGKNVQRIPLPKTLPTDLGIRALEISQALKRLSPEELIAQSTTVDLGAIENARKEYYQKLYELVAVQEEIDWALYRSFDLVDSGFLFSGALPEVRPGERPFEISLVQRDLPTAVDAAWFKEHGRTPILDIPERWPIEYQKTVERRLRIINSDPMLSLLERSDYKRRWAIEPWEIQLREALRNWLLDRLEDRALWFDKSGRPTIKSIAQIADIVSRDGRLMEVLRAWSGTKDVNVVSAITSLVTDNSVPYLAAYRLKETGVEKKSVWERTWSLQRHADENGDLELIPMPPKYVSGDFVKLSYWHARGELDIPKERFILYPDAGRSTDPTLLLGWAGWNHAEQFLALATIQDQRQSEGEVEGKFVPLVAGMNELLFWVQQWHQEVDPLYGTSMAAFCAEQLEQRRTALGLSTDQLTAWRPVTTGRSRKPKPTTPLKENA